MDIRTLVCASLLGLAAPSTQAQNDPPLAEAWNIRPSGIASSSGDIVLRVIPPDGSDPVEVTVPVLSGSTDEEVARSIRRAMNSRLRSDHFDVAIGEGANVLVTSPRGRAIFGVGLVTSDVDNMRVFVNSTQPVAQPAIPAQPGSESVPQPVPQPPGPQSPGSQAPGGVTVPGPTSTPLPQKSLPSPRPATQTPVPSIRPPSGAIRPPNTGSAPPAN